MIEKLKGQNDVHCPSSWELNQVSALLLLSPFLVYQMIQISLVVGFCCFVLWVPEGFSQCSHCILNFQFSMHSSATEHFCSTLFLSPTQWQTGVYYVWYSGKVMEILFCPKPCLSLKHALYARATEGPSQLSWTSFLQYFNSALCMWLALSRVLLLSLFPPGRGFFLLPFSQLQWDVPSMHLFHGSDSVCLLCPIR